jgi:hypothetical protein
MPDSNSKVQSIRPRAAAETAGVTVSSGRPQASAAVIETIRELAMKRARLREDLREALIRLDTIRYAAEELRRIDEQAALQLARRLCGLAA